MTFGSVFAGIGGLDLGLERVGLVCKWQIENEPYCQRVLAKHWPNVPRFGNVQDVKGADLEWVDLICGGFPCQDISNAGKREGIRGARSGLWAEMCRLVCEVRPRFVLVENVAALLVRGMDVVLGDLAESGYDAEWDCIPAAAVGAPHIRNRVFILAYAQSGGKSEFPASHARFEGRRSKEEFGCAGTGGGNSGWRAPERAEYRCGDSAELAAAMANANRERTGRRKQQSQGSEGAGGVADDDCAGQPDVQGQCAAAGAYGRSVFGADGGRPQGIWALEPDVGRVADGVPARVDRLRALGNAVVPQVAEFIGRRIIETIDLPKRKA